MKIFTSDLPPGAPYYFDPATDRIEYDDNAGIPTVPMDEIAALRRDRPELFEDIRRARDERA